MSVPEVGDRVPAFALTDTHGTTVTDESLAGEAALIVFVPFAFSGICTDELCELRDNLDVFSDAGVRIVVISTDSVFTLKAWAAAEGYTFDLLSDFWPHGAVARAFGVLDETSGHALRGTFLIDADGVVRWRVVNGRGQARSLEGYREAVAALAER